MGVSVGTAQVLWLCVCAAASYLVCGIPFGLIIASRMAGIDVRTEGSGNIGMTNVARSAGATAAALTFACDVGKGVACMLVSRWVLTAGAGVPAESLSLGASLDWMGATLFSACVLGHVFSVYLGFHGGKGISVGFGAALVLWWPVGLGLLAVFLLFSVPSRYVSLGSVCAAVSLPVQGALWRMTPAGLVPLSLAALVVVWGHRANIGRLVRGEERPFSIKR